MELRPCRAIRSRSRTSHISLAHERAACRAQEKVAFGALSLLYRPHRRPVIALRVCRSAAGSVSSSRVE